MESTYETEKVRRTIERVYRAELDRPPDVSGLETYLPLLLSGEQDAAWLRDVLRYSPEGRARAEARRERRIRAWTFAPLMGALWLTLFGAFVALGSAAARVCCDDGDRHTPRPDVLQRAWIGFGLLLVILYGWSLFAAVNASVLWLVGVLVFASVLVTWRRDRSGTGVSHAPRRTGPLLLFLLIGCAVGVVYLGAVAQRDLAAYDTGLYHLQAVRWANTYPAVPGLANLHIRLGTGSAWFLLAACLNHGPLTGLVPWVLPGFAAWLFTLYLLHAVLLRRGPGFLSRSAAALMIPYAFWHGARIGPHLYFDAPAQFALMVTCIEVLKWYERGKHSPPLSAVGVDRVALLSMGSTAAISFVIKPLGAPAFIALTGLFLWNLRQHIRHAAQPFRRAVWPVMLPAALLTGWLLRNAVLAGWLFFPAPMGRLPVDWAVPLEPASALHADQMQSVRGQQAVIQAWARRPGPEYARAMDASWRDWMPYWFDGMKHRPEIRWLFPLGALAFLFSLILRWRTGPLHVHHAVWPVTGAALLWFWFTAAPDIRFADGLFMMWFAVGVTMAADALRPVCGPRIPVALVALTACVLLFPTLHHMAAVMRSTPWEWGRAHPVPMTLVTVNDQSPPLRVYVPTNGDRAGDAPIPSAPYPNDRLTLRVPGALRHGFRIR